MRVLCTNSGSSSLKLAVLAVNADGDADDLGRVLVERVGRGGPGSVVEALSDGLATLGRAGAPTDGFDAVAHRIVHGGPGLQDHVVVDDDVRRRLDDAVAFAPLHLPAELAALDAAAARFPGAVAIACLDTAFHATLPEEAWRLPVPDRLTDAGVRRYGFHGLNVQHVVEKLGARLGRRCVVAHLGSGSSCTALADGRSVATSMGFSPTGGVVMGTRTGDLDPGVLVHVLRTAEHAGARLTADDLEHLLDRESGLLALSGGRSDDVRDLGAAAARGDGRAALALEVYARSVAGRIAVYAVELEGLDQVVFTGGVGEHAAAVRDRITSLLEPAAGGIEVLVVPADEERVMTRIAVRLLGGITPAAPRPSRSW